MRHEIILSVDNQQGTEKPLRHPQTIQSVPSQQGLWENLRQTYEAMAQHVEADIEFDHRRINYLKARSAWLKYTRQQRGHYAG
jgi:hypothetical protein